MIDRVFIDTNVLVYAYDRSEMKKLQQAVTILERLDATGIGVISAQVLAEFFVTTTRKLRQPLSPEQAYQRVQNYMQIWQVIDMTALIILEAARGVLTYQFSMWDAQIWAAAKLNQIELVFSEDFNPGAVIEGVRFINPFAPDFRLEEWL